jgi:K+/H+ antiporter YhaU regulatory subunit KhtT
MAGRRLQDLPGSAVPLLVRHADGQLIVNPPAGLQLRPGDVLVVFGTASGLNPLLG